MEDTEQQKELIQSGENVLSRTPMNDPHEQTVKYVGSLLMAEKHLANIEEDITEISLINPLCWREMRRVQEEFATVSSAVHEVQRAAANPENHLHEVIDIEEDSIDDLAVSQILTQLGWEYLPRFLDRLLTSHDRVGGRLDAKRQQRLAFLIVVFSLVAVVLSIISISFSIFL